VLGHLWFWPTFPSVTPCNFLFTVTLATTVDPWVYRKREIKSSFISTEVFGTLAFLAESEGGRLLQRPMQELTWHRTKCGVDIDCVGFHLDNGTEIPSCAVGPACSSVKDRGRLTLLHIWGCVGPHRFAELHQCLLYFRFSVRRVFLCRYCQGRTACRWGLQMYFLLWVQKYWIQKCRNADMSLARPGRKQATATEDFEFHISYL